MKHVFHSNLLKINSLKSRIKELTFFACFLFTITFSAQKLEWANGIGSTDFDYGFSIVVNNAGDVYTAGYFKGTVDFDPGPANYSLTAAGGQDAFISKYSNNGDLIWAKQMGGTNDEMGLGIALDLTGNVYATGYFKGTADFDPNGGVFNMSAVGSFDAFIVKLDSQGNYVWAKRFGGAFSTQGRSLSIDKDGNVYSTGSVYSGTSDFDPGTGTFNLTAVSNNDVYISKLDVNGNFIWAKQVGGSSDDHGYSLTIDTIGNVFVGGFFHSTNADFDPNGGTYTLSSAGSADIFVLKLNSSGNLLWAKRLGGASWDEGFGIAVDLNGNVYSCGDFQGAGDYDPGVGVYNLNLTGTGSSDAFISKLDSSGNFVWAKKFGSFNAEFAYAIQVDKYENVYTTGLFINTTDFDPNDGIYNLTTVTPGADVFLSVLNSNGDFILAESVGGTGGDQGQGIAIDNKGYAYITGRFQNTVDFDPSNTISNVSSVGSYDAFVSKYYINSVHGKIYNDFNENCIVDLLENGLNGRRAIINPGSILVETDANGYWYIDSLPTGNYTITSDTLDNWSTTCMLSIPFSVGNDGNFVTAPYIGLNEDQVCVVPDVSITAPVLRRCFSNQKIYVQATNKITASGPLINAFVDVELDPLLAPTSASLSYTSLGSNQYRFVVGSLNPGQSVNFTINVTVSCAANLQQTLCMEATVFPADSCVFDTIPTPPLPVGPGTVTACALPWDKSSLSVGGYCANDTVYFTITNNGSAVNGNMLCYAPIRVYVDGVLTYTDSIMLGGGQTITYSYPGNGQTWVLQADQHPLHPGNSHPNAHVEACGDLSNWTRNLVNNLPLDDADPVVDIYCGIVSGSYDPNDKIGFPTGLGTEHEILSNQQLQYLIRFQNTGTDTAFNIVVRDTLDTDLNIFSVVPGVASHNYSFRMYGPRVLEWTFNNIMLPDSNVNEATSHGFLTFTVYQQPNLQNGTTILNDADIYFDFNAPVITNETVHTINNWINAFPVGVKTNIANQASTIKVYPNPTKGGVSVELKEVSPKTEVTILNVLGQQISKQQFYNVTSCNLTIEGEPGVYFIKVVSGGKTEYVKLLKL